MKARLAAILFDFGGTLDAPGIHPRTLLLDVLSKKFPLLKADSQFLGQFQGAYTRTDQAMISEKTALGTGLEKFNVMMFEGILKDLGRWDPHAIHPLAQELAMSLTQIQRSYLNLVRDPLTVLSRDFTLGIISNFTGNLETILHEEDLSHLFTIVLDSFHVGHSKPDVKIFEHALRKLQLQAAQCLFVGDNWERDMMPAQKLGMQTAWITENQSTPTKTFKPTYLLTDLRELPQLIQMT